MPGQPRYIGIRSYISCEQVHERTLCNFIYCINRQLQSDLVHTRALLCKTLNQQLISRHQHHTQILKSVLMTGCQISTLMHTTSQCMFQNCSTEVCYIHCRSLSLVHRIFEVFETLNFEEVIWHELYIVVWQFIYDCKSIRS